MVRAVIVGNGAREHAIAKALVQSGATLKAFMKSNNPGIAKLAENRVKLSSLTNFKELVEFSQDSDFVVVGPEAPLVVGVANALNSAKIPCIGPTIEAAQLEGSKIFTRELLRNHNIKSNILFQSFDSMDGVEAYIDKIGLENVVVKPDGLTGGKGVKVFGAHLHSKQDVMDYCKELNDFVIEEKLDGEEFTLQTFVDGSHVIPTPLVQDHKRAYEGDEGPNCYSYDTEILTETGWKTFDQVNLDDKVMTFDHEERVLKFQKPEKIHWMKHNGEMIHFKHRELDLLVTPNHRMLVKYRKSEKIEVIEAEFLEGEGEVFLTGKWKGESPKYYTIEEHDYNFNRILEKKEIKFEDWIQFMALYLSEGYVLDNEKEHRVYICQTKKSKHFKDFKRILSKLPFKFSFSENDSKFRINSIQLTKILKSFGKAKDKFIPTYIKNAKKEHIIDFLNTFVLGDGSLHYGRMRFYSSSKKMMDDIQELIMKIGKSSIITIDKRKKMLNPINKKYYDSSPVYSTEIKPERKVGIRKKDIKKIKYNNYVGCVTVPTGFVVVRRNNRIAISGNTGGMGSYSMNDHLMPFISQDDVNLALSEMEQSILALKKETGAEYKGFLYGQFMKTRKGIKLVEYNVRFGDPEAMNVLGIMESNMVDLCFKIMEGTLTNDLIFKPVATVCKYLVPDGYPVNPAKNQPISVNESALDALGIQYYYASVDKREDGVFTTGSRTMGLLGTGSSLEEAEKLAEKATQHVTGQLFHRKDIGTTALLQKRIDHMDTILG